MKPKWPTAVGNLHFKFTQLVCQWGYKAAESSRQTACWSVKCTFGSVPSVSVTETFNWRTFLLRYYARISVFYFGLASAFVPVALSVMTDVVIWCSFIALVGTAVDLKHFGYLCVAIFISLLVYYYLSVGFNYTCLWFWFFYCLFIWTKKFNVLNISEIFVRYVSTGFETNLT